MTMPNEDELSLTFAALADPTRRAILARLAQGEATVNELAAPFNLSEAARLVAALTGGGTLGGVRPVEVL